MTPYQVGVAAEAFAAALFARAGCHVSVQYGANQPGYDLVVEKDKRTLLISVKGSQDGGWGLTQSYLKNADYHGAVDAWLEKQGKDTIFCFVQFKNKGAMEMPQIYLVSANDVSDQLKSIGGGLGDTVLRIEKVWNSGRRAGCIDRIPAVWLFSKERVDFFFKKLR